VLLEPYEGKLSRTVLRGGGDSDASSLPDYKEELRYRANKMPEVQRASAVSEG